MKEKAIITGSEADIEKAFKILGTVFDISCLADNNEGTGRMFNGLPFININEINDYYTDCCVIICDKDYYAMGNHLRDMGIFDYYTLCGYFLYHTSPYETMQPVELYNYEFYKKKDGQSILYVCCNVTEYMLKIAGIMKARGFNTVILTIGGICDGKSAGYQDVFDMCYTFSTMKSIDNFVKNSEFDLVHCIDETNILINIIKNSGKPVINDCSYSFHNKSFMHTEDMVLEHMAYRYVSGVIFPSARAWEIINKRYGFTDKPVCIIEEDHMPAEQLSEIITGFYNEVMKNGI